MGAVASKSGIVREQKLFSTEIGQMGRLTKADCNMQDTVSMIDLSPLHRAPFWLIAADNRMVDVKETFNTFPVYQGLYI